MSKVWVDPVLVDLLRQTCPHMMAVRGELPRLSSIYAVIDHGDGSAQLVYREIANDVGQCVSPIFPACWIADETKLRRVEQETAKLVCVPFN